MTIPLRYFTADQAFQLGPAMSDATGAVPLSNLSIDQSDIRLSKKGGAFAAKKDATDPTSDAHTGWYKVTLNDSDTNTLGPMKVSLDLTYHDVLPVWEDCWVYTQSYYDAMFSDTGAVRANAVEISGDSTAADNLEAFLDGNGITADVDLTARSLTITNDDGVGLAVTGTTYGIQATASNGNAISGVSSGGNGAGAEFTGSGSSPGVYVEGGATGDGINAVGGATSGHGLYVYGQTSGHGFFAAGNGTTKHGILAQGGETTSHGIYAYAPAGAGLKAGGTTYGAELSASAGPGISSTGTTYGMYLANNDGTKGALHAANAGDGPEINAAVASMAITGNITGDLSGSVGSVNSKQIPTSDNNATAVWAAETRTLSAATNLAIPTSDNNATAVWASGTRTLSAATNLNIPTSDAVADAVWDETSTGHVSAGKAGQQLWTDLDLVLGDTGELQTNQGAWVTATGFSTHAASDAAQEALKISVSDVQASAAPQSVTALVLAALEGSVSGGTLTVKKTDGTTFDTYTVTSDADASPVTGVTEA